MNKYEITFYARQNLAIGVKSKYKRIVYAETLEAAEIELYKDFESIHIETVFKNGERCNISDLKMV